MVGMDYREVQWRMRANVVPNEMSSNELSIRACNGVRMMHYTDALEAVWSPSTLLLKHWRSLQEGGRMQDDPKGVAAREVRPRVRDVQDVVSPSTGLIVALRNMSRGGRAPLGPPS